jgi:hypothetical protein
VGGFERLDRFTRAIENQLQPQANFQAALAYERAISPSLNGRTVFDDRKPKTSKPQARKKSEKQLKLF